MMMLLTMAVIIFDQLSIITTTTAFMAGSPAQQIRQQQQQQQQQQQGVCRRRNNGDRSRINLSNGDDDNSVFAKDNNRNDDVMLLPVLEADLARLKASSSSSTAKDEEGGQVLVDVVKELEEKIDNAKTAAEFGIRKTQSEFYDAFSNQNLQQMTEVWSLCDDVSCVHPMGEKLQGNEAVMQSWKQIFSGFQRSPSSSSSSSSEDDDDETEDNFRIVPSRVDITICGRTAICSCVEEVKGAKLEAVNIYRREDGKWRMTMHMAAPRMM